VPDERVVERLSEEGFLKRDGDRWVPGQRWHAAVARAAASLLARGEELRDLRVPVAWALSEVYASSSSDDELVEMVAVMTPLTAIQSTSTTSTPSW
jgi:hypothetical protein